MFDCASMPVAMFRVHARLRPVDDVKIVPMPEGATVADALRALGIPAHHWEFAYVQIGDQPILPNMWNRVRPKAGAEVFVKVTPGISGAIALIAAIAGSAATGAVAGSATAAAIAAGIGVSVKVLAGVAGALVTGAVTFALSSIFAPSQPNRQRNEVESQTFSITAARNQVNPFGVVPEVVGQHRMVPPYGAVPYTEISGSNQFLRFIVLWGHGPVEVSDVKIGNTPITNFSDVQVEHDFDGTSDSLSLYPSDASQEDLSITLTTTDVARTTVQDADELSIDVTFPNGLFFVNSRGSRLDTSVRLVGEYRKIGDPSFTFWFSELVTSRQTTVRRFTKRVSGLEPGQYQVRLRRNDPEPTDAARQEKAVWTALRAFRNTNPIGLAGIAKSAYRIRATDQLNGLIDQLNAIVGVKVPTWDGAAWTGESVSRNPAAIYRRVLTSAANKKARTAAQIDDAGLGEWYEYCESKGLYYDRVFDDESTVRDRLQDIAAAGFASPRLVDGKWGVVIDKPKSVIAQHFTPRNSSNFQGQIVAAEIPHAYRIRFPNREADFIEDERVVYDDGYDETNATEFVVLDAPGKTDPADVYQWGRHILAQARLRPEIFTFDCDIEHLVAERGDLIRFTHDVPRIGATSGRIKSVDAGLLTNGTFESAGTGWRGYLNNAANLTGVTFGLSASTADIASGKVARLHYATTPSAVRGFEQEIDVDGVDSIRVTGKVVKIAGGAGQGIRLRWSGSGVTSGQTDYTSDGLSEIDETIDVSGATALLLQFRLRTTTGPQTNEIGELSVIPSNGVDVTLDEPVTMENGQIYSLRVRASNGQDILQPVTTAAGTTSVVTVPSTIGMAANDLFMFGQSGQETDTLIVRSIEPNDDLGATIEAVPYREAIYAAADTIPSYQSVISTPSSASFIGPPTPRITHLVSDEAALTVTSEGAIIPAIVAHIQPGTAGAALDASVTETAGYQARFRESAGDASYVYVEAISADATTVLLQPVEAGFGYDVEIRAVGPNGEVSQWAKVANHQVTGASAAPSAIESLGVNALGDQAYLEWTYEAIPVDCTGFEVRYSPDQSVTDWSQMTVLSSSVPRAARSMTLPMRAGSYAVKPFDVNGTRSDAALYVNSSLEDPRNLNAIVSITEAPSFSGTKTNVAVSSSKLILDTSDTMDSWTALSDVVTLSQGVNTDAEPEGVYDFGVTDLGAVYTVRVLADMIVGASDVNDTMDTWNALSDIATLSGGVTGDEYSIQLWVSHSLTDSASGQTWTDYRPFVVGDYTARHFRFRLIMSSNSFNIVPEVSRLNVTIDAPDRLVSDQDIESGTGGKAITFSPAFNTLQSVQVAGQNLETGDYMTISNKSRTGFTVEFFNSSDVSVDRDFDYQALGFGYERGT